MVRGYPYEFKTEFDIEALKLADKYTGWMRDSSYEPYDRLCASEHEYKVWREKFEANFEKIQAVHAQIAFAIGNVDITWRLYRDAEQAGIVPKGVRFDSGIEIFSKQLEEDLAALDRCAAMSKRLSKARLEEEAAKKKKKEAKAAAGDGAKAGAKPEKHPGGRPQIPGQPMLRALTRLAADSYFLITGKWPGRSNAGNSPFRSFLIHTIEAIPEQIRPPVPSATTVACIVREWAQRSPVYQQGKNSHAAQ